MLGASAINPRRAARRSLGLLCAIILTLFLSQGLQAPDRETASVPPAEPPQPRNWTALNWTRTRIGKNWHARTNQKVLGIGHSNENEEGDRTRTLEKHFYCSDGLLEVNPNGPHPIFELMRRAEEEWEDKLLRASTTLEQAVAEYQRRYKRMPPPGFDEWWEYVEDHNVQLPDEYDQIYRDLEPFHGMNPKDLLKIQHDWEAHEDSFTVGKDTMGESIALKNCSLPGGDISRTGLAKGAYEIMELLKEVESSIPPFRAVFSPHDNPNLVTDYALRKMAIEAAAARKFIDTSKALPAEISGWIAACAPESPARKERINWGGPPISQPSNSNSKTFIYDHYRSMDPCQHPSHLLLHGQFISHRRGPVPDRTLIPQFSFCVTRVHHDIISAMPINWIQDIEPREDNPEWEERWDPRLQWRGSNTGIWHADDRRWDLAQRARLVRWAGDGYDIDKLGNLSENMTVLMPVDEGQRVGLGTDVRKAFWAPAMLDIAFAGEPSSCPPEMCERLEKIFEFRRYQSVGEAGRYKYVIDVDGHGWSSRFKRLITSNALVFKSTIYPEWYTDRVAPWVHYVPIQVDLSDLWDVLTFFRGDPSGNGAHDDHAKKIAKAGREWSKSFWRKEDMVAYMFRLFLEYARVMDPERKPYDPSAPNTNRFNRKRRQAEESLVSAPSKP
ncbi:hypothetical protein NLJ89_g6348 [Agrocybe chaxingu]|uniref:Glycosyl transferase CAP10 domain-containing protein n=1 Tax=Agrocybe chaxingu TaxID=84603 RepID=A0A9W8JWN4_9AGAR|nr:hypothetical protein NLJ89_g6348 [Agrocybe chaxingu]